MDIIMDAFGQPVTILQMSTNWRTNFKPAIGLLVLQVANVLVQFCHLLTVNLRVTTLNSSSEIHRRSRSCHDDITFLVVYRALGTKPIVYVY